MRVPDDVLLLWTDDNWGNIRRLPAADERDRPGGAGVYYHFGEFILKGRLIAILIQIS